MEIIHEYNGLSYAEDPNVYTVEEDTLALLNFVLERTGNECGNILDMGAGTGLVSMEFSRRGWGVTSVDREPRSLMNLRRNLEMNGLTSRCMLSDLFSGLPRSYLHHFDIATFNPPYIPDTGDPISNREGMPLFGGPSGWEILSSFLTEVGHFLRSKGRCMLLAPDRWDMHRMFSENELIVLLSEPKDVQGERFFLWEISPLDK